MDLITSIFDDKRDKKPRPKKSKPKPRNDKTYSRTNSASSADRKPKTTSRSTSHNSEINVRVDNLKSPSVGRNGRDNQRGLSQSKSKITKQEQDKKFTSQNNRIKREAGTAFELVNRGEKFNETREHSPADDFACIRNFNKYFDQDDCIENNFESALEVYNDCTYDERDAEFGRESYETLDRDYFLEAYNREGDELVQSSVELSFDNTRFSDEARKSFQEFVKRSKSTAGDVRFASDEEKDDVFVEAYNSLGNEIRKTSISNAHITFIEDIKKRASVEDVSQEVKSIREIAKGRATRERDDLKVNYSKQKSFDLERKESSIGSETNETSNNKVVNGHVKGKFENENYNSLPLLRQKGPKTSNNLDRSSSLNAQRSYIHSVQSNSSAGSYELDGSKSVESANVANFPELDESDDEVFRKPFALQSKAEMVIAELIDTEKAYIKNLIKIQRDYINYFKNIGLDGSVIFGNIIEILNETKEFYRSLRMCGYDHEVIAKTFIDYKYLFETIYPEYLKNKIKADRKVASMRELLNDRQRKLDDKLNLSSYLLNPMQRLGRYILLLENLQKNASKSDDLENAIKLLKTAMSKGNDYVVVGSIQGLPDAVDLTKKGSFIANGKFTLIKPKKEDIVIFLFDEIIVFTTPKHDNDTEFLYRTSIEMNDLTITTIEGCDNQFHLKNYTKAKLDRDKHTYVIEAKSVKLKEYWAKLIGEILWKQLKKFKENKKTYTVPETPKASKKEMTKHVSNAEEKRKYKRNISRTSTTTGAS